MPSPTFYRLVFGFSVALLTLASLTPIEQLPPQALNVWDKAQHALGFGWLALWGMLAFPTRQWETALALIVWGGVIELLQIATGWRYGEWLDWLADGIGILLVCLPFLLWRRAQ